MKNYKVFIVRHEKPRQEYFDALEKAGIEAEWGIAPENVDDYDGLLIPGGVDVNPKLYGEKNTASVKINDYLDEITMSAIKLFYESDKPILGICRGLQILNVYFGGSLHQDIPNHKDVTHKIFVEDNNILFDYYGKEFEVNSIHHQCINRLAEDFDCLARAEDGVIEAFMHNSGKILGTQFHPERIENGAQIFEIFKKML